MKKLQYSILVTFIISLNSCILCMGLKKPVKINSKNYKVISTKYGIDTSYFIDTLFSKYIQTSIPDSEVRKNHLQPLQAMYFNKNGKLISFHINCYAPGFPNLKWNVGNKLGSFPPQTLVPIDTFITLQSLEKYINNVEGKQLRLFSNEKKYDYFVVLFWNDFMGKQTKIFLSEFKKCNDKANQNIHIIYVNNDNLYSY